MLFDFRLTRCLAVPLSLFSCVIGLASCGSSTVGSSTVSIKGAGASFPALLYDQWFSSYEEQHPGVKISYESVGSGIGIQQFLEQRVDFAATDEPLTAAEQAKFPAERGQPIQLPVAGSAIVLAYNLEGVTGLRLSREAYCGVVTGNLTNWSDPVIAADNPRVALPNLPITFVHRADSSGTTAIFTHYLSQACLNWRAGASKTVRWSRGIGALGNEGVTAAIKQTKGAIGYTAFAYAERSFMAMAALENQAGFFIEPSPNSAERAMETAQVQSDRTVVSSEPPGVDAYPIVGLTYLLLYKKYPDPATKAALLNVIKWALTDADSRQTANTLGYAPLPQELSTQVSKALDTIQMADVP